VSENTFALDPKTNSFRRYLRQRLDEHPQPFKSFGDFLQWSYEVYRLWSRSQGRPNPSMTEYSKMLGVPNTSFSLWQNDVREPTPENADKLAARLGMIVYKVLGIPPRVPKSLQAILYNLDKLDDRQAAEIEERVLNFISENERRQAENHNTQPQMS
jgi:hypothetical protein